MVRVWLDGLGGKTLLERFRGVWGYAPKGRYWNVAMQRLSNMDMTGGVTAFPYCLICSRLLPFTTPHRGNKVSIIVVFPM